MFFQELLFKPGSVRSTTLNRNFSISFWIFGLIVVSKVKYLFTVYQSGFDYLWLLLLLLTLRIFFSELWIVFCNVFWSDLFQLNKSTPLLAISIKFTSSLVIFYIYDKKLSAFFFWVVNWICLSCLFSIFWYSLDGSTAWIVHECCLHIANRLLYSDLMIIVQAL